MKKLLTFLFALMMISTLSFGAGSKFVWTGAGSPVLGWQDALNWTRTIDNTIECEPIPATPSTWPGEFNSGDVAIFDNTGTDVVSNVPSITLGRLEIQYQPTAPGVGTFVILLGASDGVVITMRGLTFAQINTCGYFNVVLINNDCLLSLNIAGNRVKMVCEPGANFWQKDRSFFFPADYLDCDGQQGFVLQADAARHAEFVQQQFQDQTIKGWIEYVFDDNLYHYFSAPVTSVWPAAADPEFSTQFCRKHNTICVFDGDYFRKYVNGTGWDLWLGLCAPIVTNPVINFDLGRGYEYYGNPGHAGSPPFKYSIYGTFNHITTSGSGAPVSITLPINAAGWNLVGNPFPSAITFAEPSGLPTAGPGWTWNENFTNPVAYWWDNGLGFYRYWNWFTGLGNGSVLAERRTVPRSQGFFVYASFLAPGIGGSDITIGNLARVFRQNEFIGKSVVANNLNVTLNASGKIIDEAIVNFRDDANGTDFNRILDAYKLDDNATSSHLYFRTTDNVDVAMKTLKLATGNVMYPLYMKVASTGTYSLDVKDINTFSPNTGILLKDNKTNITVDLKVNPYYTFTATAGDDDARFSLYFTDVLYGINNLDNTFKVYSYDNSIYIQNNDLKSATGNVLVYDMIGKEMMQVKLGNDAITRINTNLNTGFYIVSVTTDKGVYNQKVYIN